MSVQPSLYEHLFPLTTLMRQRVVDNFDGDSLNERWVVEGSGGSPVAVMADGIGEGLETRNTQFTAEINMGTVRQYDFDASVLIAISRRVTGNTIDRNGLRDGTNPPQSAASDNTAYASDSPFVSAFKQLVTNDGAAGATSITTTVPADLLFTLYKVVNTAPNSTLEINNILEATSTTDLPGVRLGPFHSVQDITVSLKRTRIRYLEAFNF